MGHDSRRSTGRLSGTSAPIRPGELNRADWRSGCNRSFLAELDERLGTRRATSSFAARPEATKRTGCTAEVSGIGSLPCDWAAWLADRSLLALLLAIAVGMGLLTQAVPLLAAVLRLPLAQQSAVLPKLDSDHRAH